PRQLLKTRLTFLQLAGEGLGSVPSPRKREENCKQAPGVRNPPLPALTSTGDRIRRNRRWSMEREVSPECWKRLAGTLEVQLAALLAVAEVESSGCGFLPSSDKPKVLFDGHAFHRLTGGRFDDSHPKLSYPRWDRRKYSGSLAGEWERLEAACLLDRASALQS